MSGGAAKLLLQGNLFSWFYKFFSLNDDTSLTS